MLKHSSSWQQQLSDAISDPVVLCEFLSLDSSVCKDITTAMQQFPLRVPYAFVSRMQKGDLNDPLLKQILPLGVEMQAVKGYFSDPLNEAQYNPVSGLLHKYHGRVLLTLTGACAVNCRYCFRRHYPYEQKVPGLSHWQSALDYIANDDTIYEIILSGGDPLLIKDHALSNFIGRLDTIPHLTTLRIHTRLPIVIPDRVTDELVDLLAMSRLKVIIVLHSNHANELDITVKTALKKLRQFILLNQAVLLKGINDSATALINLSQRLCESHVLPYYLHLLDPVTGAAHFDVPLEIAKALIEEITQQLPGYLVPRLVKEVAGMASKQRMS